MKAIEIRESGGPEVMQLIETDIGVPGPDQALVRHTAIGVNFIDTYHRSGLYPLKLPTGLGVEAAGVVEAIGSGVTNVTVGDRVVYSTPSAPGCYAEKRLADASRLVKLPAAVPEQVAAAAWMKACTVEMLVERCARVAAGDVVLVPAAAGGVGQLLVQWLKAVGATVIATVGSDGKKAKALAAGADHVVLHSEAAAAARELTGAKGVSSVLDGVGRDMFQPAIESLRPRGLYVNFGNASGPVEAFELLLLSRNGSLFVTRPTMADYYRTDEDFALGTSRVLEMLPRLKVEIGQSWPLSEVAACHRALESRQTVGSSILIP